jgi:hypothetical protein
MTFALNVFPTVALKSVSRQVGHEVNFLQGDMILTEVFEKLVQINSM